MYNAEKYIGDAINSVLNQTYRNWELVIIDDGSKDLTALVIKKFLEDARIQYHYQVNAGVSVARNKGILLAKGEYIAFLDADDAWEPENLSKKLAVLSNMPEVDWVFSDMYHADANLKETEVAPKGTDENMLEKILLWESEVIPGPCSSVIVRKKCFDEGVSFDKELSTAADQDFTLQLASRYKGRRIPEPLVTYRLSSNSMSRNIAVMERDHILVYRKAAKNGMFYSDAFRRKCFSNLYIILAGSWWVNGNNKIRGLYFIVRAISIYPKNISRLIKKIFKA